jgi:cell division protein FtsB
MAKKTTWRTLKRMQPERFVKPLLAVLVLFYLGFHAVSGERGVVALLKENRKLEQLKLELAEVQKERVVLDKKVHGLSSHSLDLDLLDERARLVLGMAGKNEIVYFVEK